MSDVRQISPKELNQRMASGEELFLLDIREEEEREICHIGGELIPMGTIEQSLDRIPRDLTVVVYCRSGGRSTRLIEHLQGVHGFTNLLNLQGGVLRWSDDVDSSVTKY